ncbi:hypothetical protein ABZ479_38170 [Streptomyces sp. NPDC005722]
MACSCQSKKQQLEVVTPNGKVVFTTGNKATAEAVGKRYPGSEVREKGKTPADGKAEKEPGA